MKIKKNQVYTKTDIRSLPTLTANNVNRTLARETGLPFEVIKVTIDGFVKLVSDHLTSGGKVVMKTFGMFYPKEYRSRSAYDLYRKKKTIAPAQCVPTFKPCAELKQAVKKNVKPKFK